MLVKLNSYLVSSPVGRGSVEENKGQKDCCCSHVMDRRGPSEAAVLGERQHSMVLETHEHRACLGCRSTA